MNYNGSHPYLNDGKGLYRENTATVKSLPVNPWGLYARSASHSWLELGSHNDLIGFRLALVNQQVPVQEKQEKRAGVTDCRSRSGASLVCDIVHGVIYEPLDTLYFCYKNEYFDFINTGSWSF